MLTPHPQPATTLDHAFALVLIVALPLYTKLYGFPRLLGEIARGEPGARTSAYLLTMVIQWALVASVAFIWWRLGRTTPMLGFALPDGWRLAVTIALPLLAAGYMVLQNQAIATQPAMMEQARARMGEVSRLLPHTARELRLFLVLALTAGVCEEILYRGFLIGYASRFMPSWAAVLATAAVFGFGHWYQGAGNAVQTGIVGLLMGAIYLVTGSIWAPMVIHAIVDIGGGYAGWQMLRAS